MGSLGRRVTAALALVLAAAPAGSLAEPAVRVLLYEGAGPVRVAPEGGRLHRISPSGRGGALLVDGQRRESPWRVDGREGGARFEGRLYRGSLEILARGGRLVAINSVPLESYVAGTLHREVYESWAGEVLRAQAVATRTYALYRMGRARGPLHHLDATADDQVYGGAAGETREARRAVEATRGQYLSFAGEPILAAFHSASGGRTASSAEVWSLSLPYLVSQEVRGEELCPEAYWRLELPAAELARRLAPAGVEVGRLVDLRVVERTPSGRVARLRVEGTHGARELPGRRLRRLLDPTSLRSELFEVRRARDGFVFTGAGYGHGVGMSQWGALAMARDGALYPEILARFYPGTELSRLPGEPASLATGAGGG
jgi:stage II sporulation protein D